MSFSDIISEHIRITILRALNEIGGYSCNESILHSIVARFKIIVTRDQIRIQLAWLQEQGLVTLETVAEFYVATITPRGIDVAEGNAIVPGIKRPHPKG
ncbi:ArsR family transcriptional regulator [Geobacter pelophilus]|uniref:ArsR family transcriptional regulator n=1 Tax=Geoanaerobacter pelophilus TaxID=60036 RepID=A0AAW4LC58_9BACT|nr:ArsR family transcriptional regulator [Geoanaerobacter pelophilus]MBT0664766.1 ArsR family transcriptional regulator [Geoanaerobacter pelophilus]